MKKILVAYLILIAALVSVTFLACVGDHDAPIPAAITRHLSTAYALVGAAGAILGVVAVLTRFARKTNFFALGLVLVTLSVTGGFLYHQAKYNWKLAEEREEKQEVERRSEEFMNGGYTGWAHK